MGSSWQLAVGSWQLAVGSTGIARKEGNIADDQVRYQSEENVASPNRSYVAFLVLWYRDSMSGSKEATAEFWILPTAIRFSNALRSFDKVPWT